MTFREWLKAIEETTDTAQIASYARMTIPISRRQYPQEKEKNAKKDMQKLPTL